MPTSERITIFYKIADATGLSPWEVEIGFVILLGLIIAIIIYVVLAISRIRREIINLNLAVRYMVKLVKEAIAKDSIDRDRVAKKAEEKAPVEDTKKKIDSENKWTL